MPAQDRGTGLWKGGGKPWGNGGKSRWIAGWRRGDNPADIVRKSSAKNDFAR